VTYADYTASGRSLSFIEDHPPRACALRQYGMSRRDQAQTNASGEGREIIRNR
jgi:hypothetical protein